LVVLVAFAATSLRDGETSESRKPRRQTTTGNHYGRSGGYLSDPRKKAAADWPESSRTETVTLDFGSDPKLKTLIAFLKTKLDLAKVIYLDHEGRPMAILRFPGHEESVRRAEENLDVAGERRKQSWKTGTFDMASGLEESDRFMELLQAETSTRVVYVIQYGSGEIARIHVDEYAHEWAFGRFHFQGDADNMAEIKRALQAIR
jgi:hypothetical protein